MIIVLAALLGLFSNSELGAYDTWFNLRGQKNPGSGIVIIAMDEESIGKLGPLPWSRQVHAHLLEKLKKARVVGLDLLFDAPTTAEADKALAEAIKEHQRVILGSMFIFEQDEDGNWLQQFKLPLMEFTKAAAGIGFVNMPADKGNMVRRVTVFDTNTMGPEQPLPSFSLACTMEATNLGLKDLVLRDKGLQAGELTIPVNKLNQTWIDFWGPARTFPTYSYVDVLEGRVTQDVFKDKIVLIGLFTPTVKEDYFENPFTKGNLVLSGALPVPGVEIHASAINTYLSDRHFRLASWPVNLAFLVFVWMVTVLVSRNCSPWMGLFSTMAIVAAILGLGYLLWLHFHFWLPAAAPVFMVITVYIAATVENIVQTEMERRRTRTLFSRYVSPTVVDEIMKQDREVQLGGEKRVVTIMFADIRGFTAYSENKDPVDVIARLNEYLTVMTNSIQNQGGTLDKYLGDGLMAFFGAPLYYEDHVARAIRVAMEIQQKVEELNQKWKTAGAVPLKVAVGINTGPAVVGNVGSPERMDYTLIGEDVNLASRVEALSKLFETLIVISERSYNLLPEGDLKNSLYYLGSELVKGFSQPIACYSVSGIDLQFEKSTDKGFK